MSTQTTGIEGRFFLAPQSAFGTLHATYPDATDAAMIRAATFTPAQNVEALNEERTGNVMAAHVVEQADGVTWDVTMAAYGSGASATAPDWLDLLTSGAYSIVDSGGESTTCTGTNSHSGNTSTVSVASATGLAVGAWVRIGTGGKQYLRRITVIDGLNITVQPQLVTAAGVDVEPANGDTFVTGIALALNQTRTDANSLTLWLSYVALMERVLGAFSESHTLTLGANAVPELGIRGSGRRLDRVTRGVLNGGINDSVTTIVVDEPIGPRIGHDSYVITIDSESMLVTATASDGVTLTVTRGYLGTTPASHSDDATVYPYRPTQTVAVQMPTGACGTSVMLGQYPMGATTASLDVTEGATADPQQLGDCQMVPGYHVEPASSTVSIDFVLGDAASLRQLQNYVGRDNVPIYLTKGNVAGALLAVFLPRCRITSVPDALQNLVTVTMTAQVLAPDASTSAIYIGLA